MPDLDLNLLRTFDALMKQRSVTRAADRLGVTQPAVSHALARLRKVLDDPLFIRAQTGLQPTARAEEIAGGVRKGLLQLQNALAPTAFDPATAERHFTIGASTYFCTLLIPTLVERIRRQAPRISLRIVPVTETLVALLDQGAVDMALGASARIPARLVAESLYEEKMVWIASRDNPLAGTGTSVDKIPDEVLIRIAPAQPFGATGRFEGGDAQSSHGRDQAEWEMPVAMRKGVTVYDSQTAVALVARTDLIARVPEKVAALAVAQGRVVTLDRLADDATYEMVMIWHARQRTDPGLAWLRGRLRDTVREVPGAGQASV